MMPIGPSTLYGNPPIAVGIVYEGTPGYVIGVITNGTINEYVIAKDRGTVVVTGYDPGCCNYTNTHVGPTADDLAAFEEHCKQAALEAAERIFMAELLSRTRQGYDNPFLRPDVRTLRLWLPQRARPPQPPSSYG